MDLRTTFENPDVHSKWESAYRGNALQDRVNDRLIDRLVELLQIAPAARVLDAGCGIGDHTLRLARRGFQVTGVDISEHILATAQARAEAEGLAARCTFVRQKLEALDLPDGTFDAVHCRGVLMHIPDWERALTELCRVLTPGGRIAIVEASDAALESKLIGLLRRFRPSRSRTVATPGGVESWTEIDGQPFVVRTANIAYLVDQLRARGFGDINRVATEFWDINRFPGGVVRNSVIRFNAMYLSLGGPARPSVGTAVVARKRAV